MQSSAPARYVVFAACVLCGVLFAAQTTGGEEPARTFERDVRPILKAHCFQCHGEQGQREGGLDLRLRRTAVQGGESGPAIVPGDASASRLLQRVTSGEMPPGDKKPSAGEIEILSAWVAAGAPTLRDEPESIGDEPLFTEEERSHWAFQPLVAGSPPAIDDGGAENPIDAYLLARLKQEGLAFRDPAPAHVLVRRAYFDLLGLPPDPEEIAAFAQDRSPDAWERLVDRLLASPRYGERWGRHWLDVAGYADSEGYTDKDPPREWAWCYRDYVIRSFNADKPFDRFLQQQLAGDELTAERANLSAEAIENLTAVGFLRMAPDGVGGEGVDRDTAVNQNITDTLQVVGAGILGLTLHCAQCHDHRYDPITQTDYYRVRAIFEPGLAWKNRPPSRARLLSLYTDADRAAAAQIEAEAVAIEKEREAKAREFIARTLEEQLALAPAELRQPLQEAFNTPESNRTPQQQALLKDHPSVANISTGSLYLYDGRRPEKVRQLEKERQEKEQRLVAEIRAKAIAAAEEGERAALEAAAAAAAESRTPEQAALLARYPAAAVTPQTLAMFDAQAAAELAADAQRIAAWKEFQPAAELKKMADQAAAVRARKPEERFLHTLLEPAGEIHPTRLFRRGDHLDPAQEVAPGDLSVLESAPIALDDPALPTTGRRLAYARQLTSGRHPLVARVLVNRVWMHHFGRGLVNTPADFGVLGERPTHPELLDYLAARFSRPGDWSLKSLHRLILTSRAWRQASLTSGEAGDQAEESLQADPENKLVSRMAIRRLEAEPLRDALLAVSGRLNAKMFGPPVPVMEDEVGQVVIGKENLDGEGKVDKSIPLHGEERRRSVYVQVRRSQPLAVLETFDSPAMSPHCERRDASTAASQSLLLMNNALSIETAMAFAERVRQSAGEDEAAQVQLAFQIAFGRPAGQEELDGARRLLAEQRTALANQSAAQQAANEAQPPLEVRALASLCHGLLSANEFLYVD